MSSKPKSYISAIASFSDHHIRNHVLLIRPLLVRLILIIQGKGYPFFPLYSCSFLLAINEQFVRRCIQAKLMLSKCPLSSHFITHWLILLAWEIFAVMFGRLCFGDSRTPSAFTCDKDNTSASVCCLEWIHRFLFFFLVIYMLLFFPIIVLILP